MATEGVFDTGLDRFIVAGDAWIEGGISGVELCDDEKRCRVRIAKHLQDSWIVDPKQLVLGGGLKVY